MSDTKTPDGSSPSGLQSADAGHHLDAPLSAARLTLSQLSAALGDEPFGSSRVSIYASDLYALVHAAEQLRDQTNSGAALVQTLLEALSGAIGALEFSRDYHNDLGNAEQAFAQDKLDAALAAIAKAEGR